MKRKRSRLLAFFTAICLLATLLPTTAMADELPKSVPASELPAEDEFTYHVATYDELKAALAAINTRNDSGEYAIFLTADLENPNGGKLNAPQNSTVTILGNGHSITWNKSGHAESGIVLSKNKNCTVNLGAPAFDPLSQYNELTLVGQESNDIPPFIYIEGTCTVNMYDGVTIRGAVGNNYFGGGVLVKGAATFHMYGGVIEECGIKGGSNCYGGGVAAVAGGQFIMDDGVIRNCFTKTDYFTSNSYLLTNCAGGGVFVHRGASFVMNGGSIENCTASGVSVTNDSAVGGGVAVMTSGAAWSTYGGYGYLDASFVMNGGEINDCHADAGGGGIAAGGYYVQPIGIAASDIPTQPNPNPYGVYVEDAVISGNDASFGGGVFLCMIRPSIPLTFTNTEISGNEATGGVEDGMGGGLMSLLYYNKILMDGCDVSDNTAEYGGGIYLDTANSSADTAEIHISDCDITDNEASEEAGGVFYGAKTLVYISGVNTIQDNIADGKKSNVNVLDKDHPLYVEGNLSGSQIGLSDPILWYDGVSDTAAGLESEIVLTDGFKDNNSNTLPYNVFTSDHETWFAWYGDKVDDETSTSTQWTNNTWKAKSGVKYNDYVKCMSPLYQNLRYNPTTNTIVHSSNTTGSYQLAYVWAPGEVCHLAYKVSSSEYRVICALPGTSDTSRTIAIPSSINIDSAIADIGNINSGSLNSATNFGAKVYAQEIVTTTISEGYDYSNEVRLVRTSYTLHYNDGVSADKKNWYIPTSPEELETPSRDGYGFIGWYDNAEFSGAAVDMTPDENLGNVDFYAKWERNTYTVSYNMNGHGTPKPDNETVEEGETFTKPSDPTETDFRFTGWYTEPACENLFDFTTPVSSSMTLYAGWRQVTYTLHFNDGVTPDAQDVYSSAEPEDLPVPVNGDLVFGGWYTDAAFVGTPVTTTPDSDLGDVAYYAQWLAPITVSFDLNGHGTSAPDAQIVGEGQSPSEPAAPADDDYNFTAWYTDAGCEHKFSFSTPITEDMILYAGWELPKYFLHYGDGRDHDGEFGYYYAEGEDGYYVGSNPEKLPTEIKHFSEQDTNHYPGVKGEGYYFLSWMRYVETEKDAINEKFKVYTFDGQQYSEITDLEQSNETLYQFLPALMTPSANEGDIDFYAQWVFIDIDIDVEVSVDVDITISGIGEDKDLVVIDDNQRGPLAKNVDLEQDVLGYNTEIKITAYVKNVTNDDEFDAVTAAITKAYGKISKRIDYDVSVEKDISVDGTVVHSEELHELAEAIEIIFAVPDKWQSNGTLHMMRTHTDPVTGNISVTELLDLDQAKETVTVSSDEFSTYTMVFVPASGGTGGGGGGSVGMKLTYQSNGGTKYPAEFHPYNSNVSLDKKPIREGYIFAGWFADEELTKPISSITMNSSKTVYAGWVKSGVPEDLNGSDHFAYVIGYNDGYVRPMNNITRAEVTVIFFRLLKPEVRDGNLTAENTFTDVNEGDWCNIAISTMAKLGIVRGKTATEFKPYAPITRAEMATICARFLNEQGTLNGSFSDISGHWAEEDILRAASQGWVQGYTATENAEFRPNALITRAETMTMINRVLNRIPESVEDLLDDMIVWPDNTPDKWFYLAVQEATNSHDHVRKDEVYETWTALTQIPDWTRYEH